jgi:hypothetical protein
MATECLFVIALYIKRDAPRNGGTFLFVVKLPKSVRRYGVVFGATGAVGAAGASGATG